MAGYFRKMVGRVFDGEHVAAEDLTNGIFASINSSGKVEKLDTADTNTVLRCVEKTSLWGLDALVLDVVSVGNEAYMVQNDFPVEDPGEPSEPDMVIKTGALVKMKRLLPGEQIIISVDSGLYGTAEVNGLFDLSTDGKIAAHVGG